MVNRSCQPHGLGAPVEDTSLRQHMWRRTIAASVIALVLVGVDARGQPDGLDTVVGVLPDGTRYELRHPPGLTIGEVEGVDAVPVWVNWPPGLSYVVGVTNFYRADTDGLGLPTPEATAGQARVVDGQLTVRAGRGSWRSLCTTTRSDANPTWR